jgi:hypothetical protein
MKILFSIYSPIEKGSRKVEWRVGGINKKGEK